MGCLSVALSSVVLIVVVLSIFDEADAMNVAIGRSSARPGKRNVASGRWNLRPGKRSIATGRANLRPGKRSGYTVGCNAETLDGVADQMSMLLNEVDKLADQIKSCAPPGVFDDSYFDAARR